MPKYIAFLRAINVGSHTVKMDQLRSLFAGLGFSQVETFIASGNVIFDSNSKSIPALQKKVESCLQKALGYEVLTFIRSTAELAAIATHKPFDDSELNASGNAVYVGFMYGAPSEAAKKKLLALASELDDFHLHGSELYWLLRTRFSESKISGELLARTLGMPMTLRNSTTVKKLAAKYPHKG